MTRTSKDVVATGLTGVAVAVFVATHEGWNVPLVGDSHRWAAVVILLIGVGTCGLGAPTRSVSTVVCAVLGSLALLLGILAVATGALTPLSLLVVDIVALWGVSTFRHARGHARKPLAT